MWGVRLINPPRFRNEQWEERSGSIRKQTFPQQLSPVLLIHGTTWGAGLSPPRGSPGDLSQPGHRLQDLPIGDKRFRFGVGRGLSSALPLCCLAGLVPRSHPASATAFVLHPTLPLRSSLTGLSARTAPRGCSQAARGLVEEPPRWKKCNCMNYLEGSALLGSVLRAMPRAKDTDSAARS